MLYKKNQTSSLDPKLFQNPTSEYRGTPFWAWNCKVSKEDVDRTLNALKKMGMAAPIFTAVPAWTFPISAKNLWRWSIIPMKKAMSLA